MTAREDTGAMRRSQPRLSPERVRAQEFSRASLGRRGYNEEEVRLFIARVAEDMAASDAEKMSLRSEIERLRDRFREEGAAARPDADGPPAEAVNLLSAAQQQADAYVAQAQEYSRQVTTQARQQAEEILNEARERASAAAEAAARDYRAESGTDYTVELEEMERRVAWIQTFCRAVQVQMQAASDAFSREIARLGDMSSVRADTEAAQSGGRPTGAQGTGAPGSGGRQGGQPGGATGGRADDPGHAPPHPDSEGLRHFAGPSTPSSGSPSGWDPDPEGFWRQRT